MKTLEEYSSEMKENLDNPTELRKLEVEAAADYSYYASLLKPINDEKPLIWIKIKESEDKRLSDSLTEMKWRMTTLGKDEYAIKLKMKALDKIMSTIRTSLLISTKEARNQF